MERGNQFWGESCVKGRELGCPNPSANLVGVPSVVLRTFLTLRFFSNQKLMLKLTTRLLDVVLLGVGAKTEYW